MSLESFAKARIREKITSIAAVIADFSISNG
jgi:hypothetical protein